MFQNLIQQSLVYILDKNKLELNTAKVIDLQKPFSQVGLAPLPGSTMKISVESNGNTMEFNNIPCGSSMVTYGNTIVTDDKQVMLTEIENLHKASKAINENRSYYENAEKAYDSMMRELNPQFAKDKQREDEINSLKNELSSIKDMLSKVLNQNT